MQTMQWYGDVARMKARFSILPNKIDLRKENMALLAASILISIMKTEKAEYVRITTEDEIYEFRKGNDISQGGRKK